MATALVVGMGSLPEQVSQSVPAKFKPQIQLVAHEEPAKVAEPARYPLKPAELAELRDLPPVCVSSLPGLEFSGPYNLKADPAKTQAPWTRLPPDDASSSPFQSAISNPHSAISLPSIPTRQHRQRSSS